MINVGDKMLELGWNVLQEKLSSIITEKELKNELKTFMISEYESKYKDLPLNEEIDYEGLCNYINSNFLQDVKKYLYDDSYDNRMKSYKTILEKSVYHAKSRDTSIAKGFIVSLLDVINTYLSSKIPEKEKLLSNRNANDIIETVGKKIDDAKNSLIDVVKSQKNNINSQGEEVKKESYWFDHNTGEKIDSNKIYSIGNTKARIDGDCAYVEYTLPDRNKTYCEVDIKSGAVKNVKYAHPLSEYSINIPDNLKLNEKSGYMDNNGVRYRVKITQLKWGKRVIMIYDNEKLIDIDINTPSFIDEMNKIIYVKDINE